MNHNDRAWHLLREWFLAYAAGDLVIHPAGNADVVHDIKKKTAELLAECAPSTTQSKKEG